MPAGNLTKAVLPLLAALALSGPVAACSVFSALAEGRRVMARNFDWHDGDGYLLYSAPGTPRRAAGGLEWKTAHATLLFKLRAQGESPASAGGINARGLALEAVWQAGAQYPSGGELGAAEWLTYALDNFGSVRELLAGLDGPRPGGSPEPLHFMGCDPRECFVLEYAGGKPVIYAGGALPYAALTNAPYARAVKSLPEFRGFGGDRDLAGSSPLPRFARASYFLSNQPSPSLAAVREALFSLRIPSGQSPTRWSYVYDLAAGALTFDTGLSYSVAGAAAAHPGGQTIKLPLPY